jgi:hypothetical protein
MAVTVPSQRVSRPKPPSVRLGPQIIDIVTGGMYNNPLMVLREYVQNAVDAIEAAEHEGVLRHGTGKVSLTIDGQHREIVIEDNGIGIKPAHVARLLGGIGLSSKGAAEARGFRGIGRLGGLGYAEELRFETRSVQHDRVHVVCWNAAKLQAFLRKQQSRADLVGALKATVQVSQRAPTKNDGKHFFRVTLRQVRRFHRDELMNIKRVATYLGQVAPVPFNPEFKFAAEIDEYLSTISGYRCFTIQLNGCQLYRPHTHVFQVGTKKADEIRRVELFDIAGPSGRVIGRGWYADTNCLAALPPRIAMRGIRIRQGNIETGDEHFLATCFTERRFATWHIGELHVDYGLRANARRDGFEEGEEYEALLEYGARLGRYLSSQCRRLSRQRSQRLELEQALERQKTRERLAKRSKQLSRSLDGRALRHVEKKKILQNVASVIVQHHHDDPGIAEKLVKQVVAPYTK